MCVYIRIYSLNDYRKSIMSLSRTRKHIIYIIHYTQYCTVNYKALGPCTRALL